MKRISFFLFVIISLKVLAQAPTFSWVKSFDGSSGTIGHSVKADALGNVYTTGEFSGTADYDPGPSVFNLTASSVDTYISKLDGSGNFIWAKQFTGIGASGGARGYSIDLDALGNVYITGYFSGIVDFNPGVGTYTLNASPTNSVQSTFVSKLDPLGNFVWVKAFVADSGYTWGQSIHIDKFNDVLITGFFSGITDFDPNIGTYTITPLNSDAYIAKLNTNGNFIWAKNFGGSGAQAEGKSIVTDKMGNVFSTGYYGNIVDFDPGPAIFTLNAAINETYVSKLDQAGNFVWAKKTGGREGHSLVLDSLKSIYVTGIYQGTTDFDPGPGVYNLTYVGSSDVFIQKLDSSGNFIWAKSTSGTTPDYVWSVSLDQSGFVYNTGEISFGAFNNYKNMFINQYDLSGNLSWTYTFSTGSNPMTFANTSRSVYVGLTGDIYLTGVNHNTVDFDPGPATNTVSSSYGPFVLKLNSPYLGINEHLLNKSIKVYPNPTKGILNTTIDPNSKIIIKNVLGQEVLSKISLTELETIDLSNLNYGLYFIEIISVNSRQTVKVIKE